MKDEVKEPTKRTPLPPVPADPSSFLEHQQEQQQRKEADRNRLSNHSDEVRAKAGALAILRWRSDGRHDYCFGKSCESVDACELNAKVKLTDESVLRVGMEKYSMPLCVLKNPSATGTEGEGEVMKVGTDLCIDKLTREKVFALAEIFDPVGDVPSQPLSEAGIDRGDEGSTSSLNRNELGGQETASPFSLPPDQGGQTGSTRDSGSTEEDRYSAPYDYGSVEDRAVLQTDTRGGDHNSDFILLTYMSASLCDHLCVKKGFKSSDLAPYSGTGRLFFAHRDDEIPGAPNTKVRRDYCNQNVCMLMPQD
uniref:Uncharacterized protein n=1 Tax=Chromera velia CCMP2878 TaxID=1169474 RepID=A0A0G4HE06_9ALVE|eukprot:Cvel_26553.t1-p1 / transcript=Cvel_26553.t1 / gene=Cvel_26553 / organism=Chromera_velia_CCMP2878 / gene_product=hypothetical protein / transcript_product=hypothetical protein / location=Cvel_scaffold3178:2257-4758(+) / protein_length=307 / sequence_SO=supercontig / SO=protein_coding / is_pseudo=false